jgi:type I restriction enzyme M protein
MDYQELKQLEDDLWEAADQLRANSKLTASEYSMPVLGLIFLRHATTRFHALLPEVEEAIPARATGALREERIKLGFQGKAAIYLPEKARYDHIAGLPAGANLGEAIRDAMLSIEDEVIDQNGNKLLAGALPKEYLGFEPDLLAELIKIFNSPTLARASGDVFGRIYEYFLNQFAQTGAQEGGEFFTPPSLVRMIVNVIEPDHGIVLDPACGSAGMFVQTGHFIEDAHHQATQDVEIAFYGQEKSDTNTKLARMNLAVHGLEGKILQGNTFYEDQHNLLGQCDFVMANPPFNVDGVQVAKIKGQVGNRLPFGLPGSAGKSKKQDASEAVSNANSLWIQYFYSYLNATGRAGFVMAASASDAGNKDREIRQKLVETGHVDAMLSIGNKFFYTRSLPCTLWFFDKGKPAELQDDVLMIDARHVYTVVSARSHVFTDEQLANLSAIVWLCRGEHEKFTELLVRYQKAAIDWLNCLPERLAADSAAVDRLETVLDALAQATLDTVALQTVRNKLNDDQPLEDAALDAFRAELANTRKQSDEWQASLQFLLNQAALISPLPQAGEGQGERALAKSSTTPPEVREPAPSYLTTLTLAAIKQTQQQLESLQAPLKAALHALEARHKAWLKLLDKAEKPLRARLWTGFNADVAKVMRKALLPRDLKKREAPTLRDQGAEALKRATYFIHQAHWLLSRFPHGTYEDVPGLCKLVSRQEISANDWSLTPGRYVGVAAAGDEDEDEDEDAFLDRMKEIHQELAELNDRAVELAGKIQDAFVELSE